MYHKLKHILPLLALLLLASCEDANDFFIDAPILDARVEVVLEEPITSGNFNQYIRPINIRDIDYLHVFTSEGWADSTPLRLHSVVNSNLGDFIGDLPPHARYVFWDGTTRTNRDYDEYVLDINTDCTYLAGELEPSHAPGIDAHLSLYQLTLDLYVHVTLPLDFVGQPTDITLSTVDGAPDIAVKRYLDPSKWRDTQYTSTLSGYLNAPYGTREVTYRFHLFPMDVPSGMFNITVDAIDSTGHLVYFQRDVPLDTDQLQAGRIYHVYTTF